MMKRIFLVVIAGLFLVVDLMAQPPVRPEDHFWRKRVVNRISLIEKVNAPLVYHESGFYSGDPRFTHRDGIIVTLIEGVKEGHYPAYDPDSWEKPFDYEQLVGRIQEFEQSLEIPDDDWDDGSAWEDGGEGEAIAEESEWEDGGSEWEGDWEISSEEDWASPFEEESKATVGITTPAEYQIDYGPYEEVFHMVEDWIFDKNTSSMVYQIDFFEVIWTDPSGLLPEKVLARFKYKDVRNTLDLAQWKNRHNDASALSLVEVLELRIFHSILINVGGEPIRTLQEAKKRRDDMVEYEHHLWSY